MQSHARLANATRRCCTPTTDSVGASTRSSSTRATTRCWAAPCTTGCTVRRGPRGRAGHIERAAAFMLFTEVEPSVLCPVSMSYAVTPRCAPIRRCCRVGRRAWRARATTRASCRLRDKHAVTMGMGMTEKQGGSDVRANTTRAEADGDDAWGERFRITGHKWFMSAPMCDAFPGAGPDARGLSCFFLPRHAARRQPQFHLQIQRLKHKLGNQANASSEVEFHHAAGLAGRRRRAWRAADPGHGHADPARLCAGHQPG
jgi:putative acyl-CoA dehydrogenase